MKDTPLELIVYLTSFYGLRRSEVLGIRWSAIDFENKTIFKDSYNKKYKDYVCLDKLIKTSS